MASASTQRLGTPITSSRPITLNTAAPAMARFSPKRSVISADGMLESSEPTPMRAAIRPAAATDAPWSRAVSAITGRMAPLLMP
ncbi:hypothetical protein D3C85_233470 [compost metagenome]